MSIYLYLKTHNKTGLKYLGKTIQDPYVYKGSGLVWRDHIKEHGYDVTTEILYETDNMEDFVKVSLEYSYKWNIVESTEFANLIPEAGEGVEGGFTLTDSTKHKISESMKKYLADNPPIRLGQLNPFYGKKHTEEHKKYLSEIAKIKNPAFIEHQCPYCGKIGHGGAMKRWHFDNCKDK